MSRVCPGKNGKVVETMKVLNFGSLNIDYVYSLDHFVQKGETISSRSLDIFSGGKGLNQSVALGRAGAEVYHAGAIGTDGDFLTDILKDAGVWTEYVRRLTSVRTGNAIIQRDRKGDNCIILYGGANQSIEKAQVDETLDQFEAGDFLVLQNEINELPYIMEQAHQKGLKMVLNPSPNEVEACQILKLPEAERREAAAKGNELCRRLSEAFPEAMIVLTLGENGSVCLDHGVLTEQPIYRTETVDTTAAGDTFTGYFVAGLIRGLSVGEAMDLAAKAASITVSGLGAAPSIPTLAQVENMKAR